MNDIEKRVEEYVWEHSRLSDFPTNIEGLRHIIRDAIMHGISLSASTEESKGRGETFADGFNLSVWNKFKGTVTFWLTHALRELSTEQLVELHRKIGERIPPPPPEKVDATPDVEREAEAGRWECQVCHQGVEPKYVTFEEYHEGCGGKCLWVTGASRPCPSCRNNAITLASVQAIAKKQEAIIADLVASRPVDVTIQMPDHGQYADALVDVLRMQKMELDRLSAQIREYKNAVRDARSGEVKLPDAGEIEDMIADAIDRSTESKAQYRWLAETIIAEVHKLNEVK